MDNLSKADRRKCMQNIRSKNTSIEKVMFALLKKHGIKFKKHYNIAGKPDIAITDRKIAVFLDSDFWHGWRFKKWKNKLPKVYWRDKIEKNILRDKKNFLKLRREGWKVIRLWEHQIRKKPEDAMNKILNETKSVNGYVKVASLFSGCGGMDLGIEGGFKFLSKRYKKTCFKIIWANDIDKTACKTFERNFGENIIKEGDIAEVGLKKIPDCDMVVGGFPCQDFSITRATKRGGVKVKRGRLYEFFVEAVKEKQPKVFIAENVKGILSANEGMAIKLICKEFAHINGGYNINCNLYKFVEYGVPQRRERVLIIGIRSDVDYKYKKPEPACVKPVTVKEAFKNVDKVKANSNLMRIKETTRRLLEAIPEGENVNYLGKEHPLYIRGLMSNIYRRLDRDKPSPTIIACGGGGTWGYHYKEPRALTNRERARIQSFPDNFIFEGSNTEVRRQIGNSVPPVGIYPVAKELMKAFKVDLIEPSGAVEINICGDIEIEEVKI